MKLSQLVNEQGYYIALKTIGRYDLACQYKKAIKTQEKVIKYNGVRKYKTRPNKIKCKLKKANKALRICFDFIWENRNLIID